LEAKKDTKKKKEKSDHHKHKKKRSRESESSWRRGVTGVKKRKKFKGTLREDRKG